MTTATSTALKPSSTSGKLSGPKRLCLNDRPQHYCHCLHATDTFFPTVYFLLKVLATLPVSTATAERTFSTLKRLKTYLRNATGQDRLTGLALLSVHPDIDIDP